MEVADEMRDKFGPELRVINGERLREVRRAYRLHANPFLLFPRVVVSLAWLPGVRAQPAPVRQRVGSRDPGAAHRTVGPLQ